MNPEEIDSYLEGLKTGSLFATLDSTEEAVKLLVASGADLASIAIFQNTLVEEIRGYIAGGSD